MADSNDIVISAKVNTKDAEAEIKRLNDKIKSLSQSDASVKKVEKSFSEFGKKVKQTAVSVEADTRKMAMSTEDLSSAIGTAMTKIAAIVGVLVTIKTAMEAVSQIESNLANAMKSLADAGATSVDNMNSRTNEILDSLKQIDSLADDGILDADTIKMENSLVAELNDMWGDVGISIDTASGKLNGLVEAQEKLNQKTREEQKRALESKREAARAQLDAQKKRHSNTFREDDSSYGFTVGGATNQVINNIGESVGAIVTGNGNNLLDQKYIESQAQIAQAQAELDAIDAQIKQLDAGTTQADIAKTVKEEETKVTASQNVTAGMASVRSFDAKQKELELNYSNALMTGDGAKEKAELDAYMKQKNEAELERVKKELEQEKKNNADLQKRYENGLRHNDPIEQEKRQKELLASNDKISQLTDRAVTLNGILKPVVTEVAKSTAEKVSTTAQGTFDSRSLGSLGQNSVEKQQLEALKEIAENTKENNKVPVVGE